MHDAQGPAVPRWPGMGRVCASIRAVKHTTMLQVYKSFVVSKYVSLCNRIYLPLFKTYKACVVKTCTLISWYHKGPTPPTLIQETVNRSLWFLSGSVGRILAKTWSYIKDHSGYGLSQWDTPLQCNVVSLLTDPMPRMIPVYSHTRVKLALRMSQILLFLFNSLRPSDACMRQQTRYHWFR